MSNIKKLAIVAAVAVLATGAIVLKQIPENSGKKSKTEAANPNAAPSRAGNGETASDQEENLPRLVDLGSAKCVPCKMMEPILEELKDEYSDTFTVEFIDVRKEQEKAQKYNFRIIPTQIFYGSEGNELFRHEGFFSKQDILETWEEHDIEIEKNNNQLQE